MNDCQKSNTELNGSESQDTVSLLDDDDDDLDDEVSSCLIGLPTTNSHAHQSSTSLDSCSFYSSCTLDGARSQGDTTSTKSFHSYDTEREREFETTSYGSIETLQGGEEEIDQSQDSMNAESCLSNNTCDDISDIPKEETIEEKIQRKDLSYSRPAYLAGSKDSIDADTEATANSNNIVDLSFAGQVNERLGRLLGFGGRTGDKPNVSDALANIVGYEIVTKEKEKYTIYKVRVSWSTSTPVTWMIHRRYSDFLQLRKALVKEHQSALSKIPFPPKRWVGSNLEPSFLGRRLAGLQVFLASILEISSVRQSQGVQSFLCLDKPPVDDLNGLESSRVLCDTLEEAMKELREQLRKRELLEVELEHQKNMNAEKESQIENLCRENILLRQQKETLMNIMSSGRRSNSIRNLTETNLDSSKSKIETLEDFTAKFNLKTNEGPLAMSTPSKGKEDSSLKMRSRRRIVSQGEGNSSTSGDSQNTT